MKREYCPEISIVRIICIIMLVFSHAFSPWGGGWEPLYADNNMIFKYIHLLSYSFMLPAFVFISGYLFSMQNSYREIGIKEILIKKTKRLYLPTVIFGALYFIMFRDFTGLNDIPNLIVKVFCGIGHLWFLPMLFFCFIITYIINRISKYWQWNLLLLLGLALFSKLGWYFPVQGGKLAFYLFFFYLGFIAYRHRKVVQYKTSLTSVSVLAVLFLITFFISIPIEENYDSLVCISSLDKLINSITVNYLKLSYKITGVVFVFFLSVNIASEALRKNPILIQLLDNNSMGIYLIHQYVLKILYYEMDLHLYVTYRISNDRLHFYTSLDRAN